MTKFSADNIKRYPVLFFLIKMVLLLAIVIILDFSAGKVLSYFYFKQQSGLQFRTTYSIEKTTADVLVFGMSRANHHYHPDVFEKRLNMSYYNVGRNGNFMFYHYAVLKGVLKRYLPKIIILDFNAEDFAVSQDSYDRLSSLLPYYRSHPEMRDIIELKSPFEKYKLLSSIYPYNSSMFTILVGNMEFNKKRKEDNKGYIPLKKVCGGEIYKDTSAVKYEIDSIKLRTYESFIKDCINAKVKLYVVCSPYFMKSDHTDYSIKLGKEIAEKYKVSFSDYSLDSAIISNPKLFTDIKHLNDEGAKVFSNRLIDEVIKPADK